MVTVSGIVFSIIAAIFGFAYYKCSTLFNSIKNYFSILDADLRDRWILIPKLIEIAKGYTQGEEQLIEEISKLTEYNYDILVDDRKIDFNCKLDENLQKLISFLKEYSQVQNSKGYINIETDLYRIEDRISDRRAIYNKEVEKFNTLIKTFPFNIVASIFKYKEQKLFSNTNKNSKN